MHTIEYYIPLNQYIKLSNDPPAIRAAIGNGDDILVVKIITVVATHENRIKMFLTSHRPEHLEGKLEAQQGPEPTQMSR